MHRFHHLLPIFFAWIVPLAACDSTAAGPPPTAARPSTQAIAPEGIRLDPAQLRYVNVGTFGQDKPRIAVRAPGRLAFRDGAVSRLGTPASAKVTAVHVAAGQRVEQGQVLVTLTSPQATALRADKEQARLQVRLAQEMVRRQQQMAAKGVAIEVERFAAEMQLAEAKAKQRRADEAAGFLGDGSADTIAVRAPMAGTVLGLSASAGATVEPGGEPLVEVGDPNAMWVVADVFEQDIDQIRAGSVVSIELSGAATALTGKVLAVAARVDTGMRRVPVYISLDSAPGEGMRPGRFAQTLIAPASAPVAALPVAAVVVKDGHRHVVYVAEPGGVFVAREVQVGRSWEGKVEILAGLQPGERVALAGALLIDNNAEQML